MNLIKRNIILILLIFSSVFGKAQSLETSKNYVLYIFHIAKYIEWPATHDPFVIGVLGNTQLADLMIKNYKGKVIKESSIEVQKYTSLSEVSGCQILFIPLSQKKYIQEAINELIDRNVLIITEAENATQLGIAINFVMDQDETLKFELSRKAIKKTGLKLNNNLLALAILVN